MAGQICGSIWASHVPHGLHMATITKLPSGKFRAQVRKQGFYRNKTFDRKRDATAWATRVEVQVDQADTGYVTSTASMATLLDTYKKSVPSRGRSWENYLGAFKRELGTIPLNKLHRTHFQEWTDKKLAKGTQAVTIAGYLSTVAKVLDWARHSRNINVTGDIVRDVRKAMAHAGYRTRSNERNRIPDDAELKNLYALWANAEKGHLPMEELTRFAIANAMRQGEICSIRIEDVDRLAKTVIIRDRKDPREKLGNDQIVPLVGAGWDIVAARTKGKTQGRIFPYNSKSVSARFTRSCSKLGIDDLHFHDLRHAGITNLFRIGLDIPLVSIISGHKDWKNLRRYTQLGAADVHRALKGAK